MWVSYFDGVGHCHVEGFDSWIVLGNQLCQVGFVSCPPLINLDYPTGGPKGNVCVVEYGSSTAAQRVLVGLHVPFVTVGLHPVKYVGFEVGVRDVSKRGIRALMLVEVNRWSVLFSCVAPCLSFRFAFGEGSAVTIIVVWVS